MVTTIKKGANKQSIDRLIQKFARANKSKGIDAYKHCGVIKLREDPKEIQKHLRSEWN